MIVCSVAACVIQVRHEVSLTAVYRYFTRSFHREADLEGPLRSHLTTTQLAALFANGTTVNTGGLVYLDDGVLHFYPHMTRRALATTADQDQNRVVFPRLLERYGAGDVDGLLAELSEPAVRARLVRQGVSRRELTALRDEAGDAIARRRLLWRLAGYIERFAPYESSAYQLTFAEKLRFYENHHPRGRFVGMFEVLGLQLGAETDDEYGWEMAAQSHYLAVVRLPGGQFLVKDYYRNRLRTYTIRAIEHPSGRTLYKVA